MIESSSELPPGLVWSGDERTMADRRRVSQFGMFVFLASDLMLFAAFFAAYYLLRSTNSPWPPAGMDIGFVRPVVATTMLVLSSFTVIAAERRADRDDTTAFRGWLLVTMLLGLGFLVLQLYDYATIDFSISGGVYGSTYWGLTGLHTMHVIAGLSALGMLYLRSMRAGPASASSSWTAAVAPFWHLVDLVWLAVFTTIWVVR